MDRDQTDVVGLADPAEGPTRFRGSIVRPTRLAVTPEIYTFTGDEAQLDVLTRLHNLFDQA